MLPRGPVSERAALPPGTCDATFVLYQTSLYILPFVNSPFSNLPWVAGFYHIAFCSPTCSGSPLLNVSSVTTDLVPRQLVFNKRLLCAGPKHLTCYLSKQ